MAIRWTLPYSETHVVEVVSTTVDDGDFRVPALGSDPDHALRSLHRRIHPADLTWLHQTHGTEVVRVTRPGEWAGAHADAVVTSAVDCPIAVTTADCAPVVLVASTGVGVIHAGWKGALGGVIEAAAAELRRDGGVPLASLLGPCIGTEHYEFGENDLAEIARRYGPGVVGRTKSGAPALRMDALIGAACEASGWPAPDATACTSGGDFFSHRVRGDLGRQTTVAWLRPRDTLVT
ncbi:MAG: polyphenol oxidase family protein [Acidimicrobiales bacterium]